MPRQTSPKIPNRCLRGFVALSFLLSCGAALANSLDINLSDDSIQAVYGNAFGAGEFTVGAHYIEEDGNADSRWAAHLGLIATGQPFGASSKSEAGLGDCDRQGLFERMAESLRVVHGNEVIALEALVDAVG